MSITLDLKEFYNKNAKKYTQTRQKVWHDIFWLLEEIKNYPEQKIRLLELGCGSGRFLEQIIKNSDKKIEYVGVDISSELLDIAKTEFPKINFVCEDMLDYIQKPEQESFDFIVMTASFQHISTPKDRIFLLKNCYRVLKYGGKIMMLNRAYSNRFKKKFQKSILKSKINFILSLGKKTYRDVLVPWNDGIEIFQRYYHLFSQRELSKLFTISGFLINKLMFLDSKGKVVDCESLANNSLVIAEKNIYKHR